MATEPSAQSFREPSACHRLEVGSNLCTGWWCLPSGFRSREVHLSEPNEQTNGTTAITQLTENVLDHLLVPPRMNTVRVLAGAGAGAVRDADTAVHDQREGTASRAQSGTRHTEPPPGPGSVKDGKPAGVNVPLSGTGLTAAGVPDDGQTGPPPPSNDDTTISPFRHNYDLRTPTTHTKEQSPVTTTLPSSCTEDTSSAATSGQTPSKQSGGVKVKVEGMKIDVGAKGEGANDVAESALRGSTGSGTGTAGPMETKPPSPMNGKHESSEVEGKNTA
ncbi:hypothetical protein BD410DRAFT_842974 [Rickenella mellea]|uniref:Uncharacterized protein n=1 Tax=Rickenella mellea TaxID=50990 RepID=A0A4Y7PS44_9AGAM|nr:hypothetical protein BD410DRAFT_842974 [Rickenella mellea]